jgi:hypothetical protein
MTQLAWADRHCKSPVTGSAKVGVPVSPARAVLVIVWLGSYVVETLSRIFQFARCEADFAIVNFPGRQHACVLICIRKHIIEGVAHCNRLPGRHPRVGTTEEDVDTFHDEISPSDYATHPVDHSTKYSVEIRPLDDKDQVRRCHFV